MKEGIAQRMVTAPLTMPQSRPIPSAASAAQNRPVLMVMSKSVCPKTTGWKRVPTMKAPMTVPARPSTEPTERSIPAMIRTYVMPTAITTVAGLWLAMVWNVAPVTKGRSASRLKMTIRMIRTASMPR
jgi:hypothetical protein